MTGQGIVSSGEEQGVLVLQNGVNGMDKPAYAADEREKVVCEYSCNDCLLRTYLSLIDK